MPPSDRDIENLADLEAAATTGPWIAMVEGIDHTSGETFIQIGPDGSRTSDMYVLRDREPASAADVRFIAMARTLMPALLRELRASRAEPRASDSAIDRAKGMDELSEQEAFRAMHLFVDQFYSRAGNDLGILLADLSTQPDGKPLDPAAWEDWMACVRSVKGKAEPNGDARVVLGC